MASISAAWRIILILMRILLQPMVRQVGSNARLVRWFVRNNPRHPSRHVLTVGAIFLAEFLPQRGLFIDHHGCKRDEPKEHAPRRHPFVAEQQSLAHENDEQRDIDWVTHATVEAGHHELRRWCERSGCAKPVPGETRKGTDEWQQPQHDERGANPSQRLDAEQRRADAPARERPRNQARNRPWRDDEEHQRSQRSPETAHGSSPMIARHDSTSAGTLSSTEQGITEQD